MTRSWHKYHIGSGLHTVGNMWLQGKGNREKGSWGGTAERRNGRNDWKAQHSCENRRRTGLLHYKKNNVNPSEGNCAFKYSVQWRLVRVLCIVADNAFNSPSVSFCPLLSARITAPWQSPLHRILESTIPFGRVDIVFFVMEQACSSPVFTTVLRFSIISSISSLSCSPSTSFFPVPAAAITYSRSVMQTRASVVCASACA